MAGFKDEELRGKRAVVTGASRGIGVYIARALAERGCDLVLSARRAESLADIVAACEAKGVRVKAVAADLSRAEDRERLVEEAGEIDLLVNNAGLELAIDFVRQSRDDIAAQLEVNLRAPLDLSALVLPAMLARKSGVIVNVSSMSGKSPTPYNAVYAASKFGLNGFTASLAIELEGSGVHVGVVCPSFVSVGMWKDRGTPAPALMPEVAPEKVVDGVFRAIRGAQQVLVTPRPVRPLLAVGELFPSLVPALMRSMGLLKAMRGRAENEARSLDEAPGAGGGRAGSADA